ncbi:MAG: hypothetical protein DYG89_37885 [Caldilinea sp. CFX5]|nr:hypothetical protein [Caldilinea sp. CFX5]
MFWKYGLAWLPIVLLAIVNGGLHRLYEPALGELPAHQLSVLILILLLAVYTWLIVRVWTPHSVEQALGGGVLWMVLTVAFEFLFGHYVVGDSWSKLLYDYNLLAGRLWLFVPLWQAIAPALFYRLQTGRVIMV